MFVVSAATAPITVTRTIRTTIIITTTRSDTVLAEPLFDSYLMVDWSATNRPSKPGRDSVWFCLLQRSGDQLTEDALENPLTRHAASSRLRDLLLTAMLKRRSILVGFDFPLGFSHGLAARLGLGRPAWRAVWDEIADLLSDDDRNRNNRFLVAAALNRRVSGGAFPFWGCPPPQVGPFLGATHHRQHVVQQLAEKRVVDERMRGPQPGWKLLGAGSVGSQALTGIPVVRKLRDDPALSRHARVWPFETGLCPIGERTRAGRILLTEIYPSLVPTSPLPGEVKDSAQVRALVRHFAQLDEHGELAIALAGDPALSREQRDAVVTEEGWVLGVTKHVVRRAQPSSSAVAGLSGPRSCGAPRRPPREPARGERR
jgi:hypothetical protein